MRSGAQRWDQGRQIIIALAALGLLFAILALLGYIQLGRVDASNNRQGQVVSTLQPQLDTFMASLGAAREGKPEALDSMASAREGLRRAMEPLLASASGESSLDEPRRLLQDTWTRFERSTQAILDARSQIGATRETALATLALLTRLENALEEASGELQRHQTSPAMALRAGRLFVPLDRMASLLEAYLQEGLAAGANLKQLAEQGDSLAKGLNALLAPDGVANSHPARAALDEAGRILAALREQLAALQALLNGMEPALEAVGQLARSDRALSQALNRLAAAYRDTRPQVHLGPLALGANGVLLLAAAALLSLLALALLLLRDARRREDITKTQSERDEQAILRLLDEMGNLADGDLTVQATVTEDKTGAIADAINYAVEALRALVTTINDTASRVSHSAQDSRSISARLAESSASQSERIAQASAAVQSLTVQIDEVARHAGESAEVASRSVEVAGRGAQTVRDTILGMDAIRDQIQETSKRIKRLGESSQEIGEIVELIDDIADQTNILALNAAMQAAMAGEAGRGFAVVADEVQRLAERSRNATKQIEVLVRTIQADTNEAVSSMELSTSGVVEGANLAENAGDALREIENVSAYIADLTKRIADSAQRQSRQSAEINDTVQAIRALTEENNDGTRRVAESVEQLANLAIELQHSVAGFRLP
ncbi:MAG: methyl-accepting chemotaxis protein [Chromatiaceae bacterium]|nr:methyl-accepting chemotaxis protein [Chromatiaceae bacterium]